MRIINYRNIPYDTVAKLIKELIEKNAELDQLTMRVNAVSYTHLTLPTN